MYKSNIFNVFFYMFEKERLTYLKVLSVFKNIFHYIYTHVYMYFFKELNLVPIWHYIYEMPPILNPK